MVSVSKKMFQLSCIVQKVVIITILLTLIQVQVESTFSSTAAKVRRTQSMRVVKTRPVSQSTSSTSSTASHNVESESKPLASTSSFQPEIDQQRLQEIDLKPMVEEESKHVRFIGSASLLDPMVGTHSEHLDPARDGVFARMRNRMLRYGSAAAIGSAIGAGGLAAKEFLFQNNTQVLSPTNSSQNLNNQTENDNGIINPFISD